MPPGRIPPARRRDPRRVDPHVGTRVEAFVHGAELGPVAAILRDARDEVLRRWLEAARMQPFHAAHPDRAVADHIPHLFDALVAFLERSAPRSADPSAPLDDQGVHRNAREHAHDRFEQGLGAADVLTEFRLLRQEMGRALRDRLSGRGAADVVGAELLVHDALDGAATLALAALDAQEAVRRGLAAEVLRLGAERDRMLRLLDQAHDAVVAWELDGPIAFWNRGAEELYGYPAAEAIGRTTGELFDTPERELDACRAALEREGWWAGELHQRTRDGRVHLVESRMVVAAEDDRRHVLAANREITERRRAEEALRLRAELVEAAHDAIFAWDVGDGIVLWNRGAQELYGHSAAEAIGRRSHDLLGTPPEQVAAFTAALERHGRWEGELNHVTRDGRRVLVEARLVLVGDGDRGHVLETTRDLTARRAAEDALRVLAAASRELAGSLDYQTTLASVARLAVPDLADWCALDLAEEGGAIRRVAVAHADPAKVELAMELERRYPTDPAAEHGVPRVLRTGEPELVDEIPDEALVRAARSEEDVALFRALGLRSSMVVPLVARGRMLGAMSFASAESGRRYGPDDLRVAEDLAQRAALAIDNARLYGEVQDALHGREELLAIVAHDLKTPLTAVKGNADLLARLAASGRADAERVETRARAISQAAEAMTAQIGELLDAARLRAGQPLELVRRPTDLVALAYRVAGQVQETTSRHTVEVDADGQEVVGEWDAFRIERVLRNLLANAVKYSPNGGDVRVEVRREERRGRAWGCLAVHDRGIGIPAADLGRVFERYHRAANVGGAEGEGLGLPAARQIVEQHGGTLEVESVEGEGSTFTVRLPMRESAG